MTEKLFVSILEGRNLASKDSNGFSDPFVKVKLGKQKHSTKIIYKTLNPKYEGETFSFDITTIPKTPLRIECWDHDSMSSNDFMGKFELPIPEIQEQIQKKFGTASGFIEKWFPLQDRGKDEDGDITGELLLKIEVIAKNTEQKSDVLFYKWFPEIPHSETVIKEWLCVREGKLGVPTTGYLYLTQSYVCFHPSNYVVTSSTVVIPLKEITEITKRLSNLLLPTGIEIAAKKKYWFSGFIHRSTVYRMIEAQWKNGNALELVNEIEQHISESDMRAAMESSSSSLNSDTSTTSEELRVATPPPQHKNVPTMSIVIKPENVPELGLADDLTLKLPTTASVRDLFNAVHEKSAQDISLNDLVSSFEFGLPKKKKGFELSINPINVALNVGHTVTSMVTAGFASRRKVKLVLDESKPLSFYNIKDSNSLILRKKVATKSYALKFELPDKKDLVTASFDSSTQIKVIMTEIGTKYNAEFVPGNYHMMLAKQGSRGIIMEPEGILGNYVVTEQDILRIKKSCPFSTIASLYEVYNGEHKESEVVYELASHSLFTPMAGKKADPNDAKALLQKIRERLEVSEEVCKEVEARIESQKLFTTEAQLIELIYRLSINASHPFYNQASFNEEKQLEAWKESEKATVAKLVNTLVFKPEVFFGMLTVTVLEATNLAAVDLGGKSDPYCILEIDGEKKNTRARKRTLNPVWNETFVFGVQNVDAKLQLTVMDQNKLEQDNFLAKIDIPLRDISTGIPVMGWFTLPTKGKIRLHMQFSHQYSKYIQLMKEVPQAPQGVAPVDYHKAFRTLLQILIEFDNGETTLLLENSQRLLDEFATRYGINILSRNVINLAVLSKQFKPNEQYIEWLNEVLNDVDRLLGGELALTKAEEADIAKSADAMLHKLVQTVEQFKELFPQNNPAGMLTMIVECVGILNQLKKSDEKPSAILLPAVMSSVQNRFDQLLREISAKHPGAYGINELRELIDKIKVENEEDLYYEGVFPSGIDVAKEAGKIYMAGLTDKVFGFCATADYSQDAIDLFFKVRDLEKIFGAKKETKRKARSQSDAAAKPVVTSPKSAVDAENNDAPPKADPLEEAFKPILYGWLKDAETKLKSWCEKACDIDTGEPVALTVKHSPSVVDVFSSCRQAYNDMLALQLKDPFVTVQFLEIISEVVCLYAKLQCQLISKPIEQAKSNPSFTFTTPLCGYLNNIQAARGQLDELVSSVEPEAKSTKALTPPSSPDSRAKHLSLLQEAIQSSQEMCIQNAFAHLKTTLFEAQGMFVKVLRDRINGMTQGALLGIADSSKHPSKPPSAEHKPIPFTETITQYLDAQLEVLSEKLEEKLFSSLMKRLWEAIIEDLVEVVLPAKDVYTISPAQLKLIEEHIATLKDYFYANGSGVPTPFLDTISSVLRTSLSLYQKDTQTLLDLYGSLLEKPDHPQYPGVQITHVVKILATRGTTDKEAKVIVNRHNAKPSDKSKDEDKKLRDILLLPASETIIDKYVCTHDGKTGQMILTSNYLCFDPLIGGGPDSEHQIALKFTELTEIKKKRVMLVFAAMEVTTDDKKTYLFSSFVDRDGCLADIRTQITKKGNTKVVIEQ